MDLKVRVHRSRARVPRISNHFTLANMTRWSGVRGEMKVPIFMAIIATEENTVAHDLAVLVLKRAR